MKRMKQVAAAVLAALLLFCFVGCRQSTIVSYNVSKEADQFNVMRRIVVINCRTDRVLYEMIGTFALKNDNSNELEIICEMPGGVYTKHFIYLNEWTTYTVEDLSGADVSGREYEFNILPDDFPYFTVTQSE